MADSRQSLFLAAVAGNVAPILLRWWAREGISVPGDTWAAALGWLFAMALFAGFAGYVTVYIWKETTARRAFFIGLALPYILWGALADVQDAARLRRARAQTPAPPLGLEV